MIYLQLWIHNERFFCHDGLPIPSPSKMIRLAVSHIINITRHCCFVQAGRWCSFLCIFS